MEERITAKKKRIIRWIAVAILLGIPLGIYTFIEAEYHASKNIYRQSLTLLRKSNIPTHFNELSSGIAPIDPGKQQLFKTLLDHSSSWMSPDIYMNNDIIEIDASLHPDQIAWYTHTLISKDMSTLKLLLNESSLRNTSVGWITFHAQDPDDLSPGMLFNPAYPNHASTNAITEFLILEHIQTGNLQHLREWRSLNTNADAVLEIFIKSNCLQIIDTWLVRHQLRHTSNKVTQLNIVPTKRFLIPAFKTDAFFLGPMHAQQHGYKDRYHGYGLNYLDKTCNYMWGYLDYAETNAYYSEIIDIINSNSAKHIKALTPTIHTKCSPMSFLYIGHQMRALRAAISSNAHQRMCQIAMHLIHYYQQHQSLPKSLAECGNQVNKLSLGDRFAFELQYRIDNSHCFTLQVSNTHLPNSIEPGDIEMAPTGATKHRIESNKHYFKVNCKTD